MITGDNLNTAVAIAKDAGIIEKAYEHKEGDFRVMTGKQFREYVGGIVSVKVDDEEQDQVGNIENFKKVDK